MHIVIYLSSSFSFTQDFAKQYYGKLPLNQSQERERRERATISSLPERVGQTVLLRARIQTSRATGNKMVFLNLRQRIDTVQGLLEVKEGKVSRPMVKWVAGLPDESIVLVEGLVKKSPTPIQGATVSDVEIDVKQVRFPCTGFGFPSGRLTLTFNGEDTSYLWCRWSFAFLSG